MDVGYLWLYGTYGDRVPMGVVYLWGRVPMNVGCRVPMGLGYLWV